MSWVKLAVFCCVLGIVVGDIHRIVLKPERHRSRTHKRHSIQRRPLKQHYYKEPAFYNSMEDLQVHASQDFHNYFQNTYNQPKWNTNNNPYLHKYSFNSYPNIYPNEMFATATENPKTIADLIDITTSVPERAPIIAEGIDFRYFPNTRNPLNHNINDEQIQPVGLNFKPKRKRNKPNYEVFENPANVGDDHNTNFRTIDFNKDYSGYFPEINSEKSAYDLLSYGKRKKNRKYNKRV